MSHAEAWLRLWKAVAQETIQSPRITSPASLIIISRCRRLVTGEKLCGFIQSSWSKNPTVRKSLKTSWVCVWVLFPSVQKLGMKYFFKSGVRRAPPALYSHQSSDCLQWVRTFGRSKVGKMKHLHIMTDSWNNMNIYTHWHGSTKLPLQLFMLCVQTYHLSRLLSIEQVCGRGSQHTLSHTLLWFVSALIPSHSSCWAMPRQWGQISAQHYHKSLCKLCWLASPPHSSAFSLFLHEARGILLHRLTSLNDSLRVRTRDRTWELWTLSTGFPMWQTHHCLVPKLYFQEQVSAAKGWAVKLRHCRAGVPACYSMLQEKKILCYCYFSYWQ